MAECRMLPATRAALRGRHCTDVQILAICIVAAFLSLKTHTDGLLLTCLVERAKPLAPWNRSRLLPLTFPWIGPALAVLATFLATSTFAATTSCAKGAVEVRRRGQLGHGRPRSKQSRELRPDLCDLVQSIIQSPLVKITKVGRLAEPPPCSDPEDLNQPQT